jgi:hypothetical protein
MWRGYHPIPEESSPALHGAVCVKGSSAPRRASFCSGSHNAELGVGNWAAEVLQVTLSAARLQRLESTETAAGVSASIAAGITTIWIADRVSVSISVQITSGRPPYAS